MRLSSKYLPLGFLLALFYSPGAVAWSCTLPSSIQALKGSCVIIPCSFTFPGSRDSWGGKFSVAWYQYRTRGYPEIYNSRSPGSVLPEYQGRTEVLGDPELGNCTLSISSVRSEDAMSYYVWINPESVKHRFYDVTVRVEVTDTPGPLELSDPGLLTEGDRTLVTCSTLHTCPLAPPTFSWNFEGGKAVTVQERLAGGAWRTESGFNYIPSHKDHAKYLQCTATFPNQQQSRNGIYLQVKYPPKNAVVSVVGNPTLKEGDSVTLRCTSQSNPPPISYRWFFGPRKAPLKGAGTRAEVKLVDIRRDSGPFHCVAENDVGMGEDSPPAYLNVEYKPVILPQGNCTVSRTGETVTCYCVAEGNPLPGVEWHLPNRTIPGDFNSSELQAVLSSWGQVIVGVLRGPAGSLANVSCTAINQHGPSLITLPTLQAGDSTLLLIASGGAVGGLLLLTLLGIVIYKVTKNRKEGEEEDDDPTLYITEGNGESKTSLKGQKPPVTEDQINMYSQPKAGGSPTAVSNLLVLTFSRVPLKATFLDASWVGQMLRQSHFVTLRGVEGEAEVQGSDKKELSSEAYETMEVADDYESLSELGATGHYGAQSNWQPTSGTEQIYSNV